MDYILLPLLDNKYPSFRSYAKTGESKVTLYGIYKDVNKHEFTVPSIDNIKVVANTSFRFILSIKKTNDDVNPLLYTSDLFYSDLQDSIDSNNPYLARFALLDSSIVKISLQDSIDLFAKLEPLEKDVPVAVIKNIFAYGKDKSGKSASTLKTNLAAKRIQLEDLRAKLTKLDSDISNDERIVKESGLTAFIKRDNKKTAAADLDKLKANRLATETAIKALEDEIKSISGTTNSFETTPGAEPNTFAKPAIPDVTLTANDIDIDYDILVRYIDWMVSKNTYSIDTAETGGVIPAEQVGEWAGDLIDNYKARIAKKEADRLQSLGSGSLNNSGSNSNTLPTVDAKMNENTGIGGGININSNTTTMNGITTPTKYSQYLQKGNPLNK
jgi:hypothetical protein